MMTSNLNFFLLFHTQPGQWFFLWEKFSIYLNDWKIIKNPNQRIINISKKFSFAPSNKFLQF
jgi:hypothetical protein